MNAFPAISEVRESSFANEQVAAFLADTDTIAAVHAALDDRWPNAVLHEGGLAAALGALSQDQSPRVLIVDISGVANPNPGIRSLLALCDRETRVIALGTVNDVGYYRSLVALGVGDYLVKPFDAGSLQAAVESTARPRLSLIEEDEADLRQRISVIGVRGGIGATTVAVGIAWLLAHEQKKPTAILDLDLQFGTVGLQLDLEPSSGLREALENPDRIDALFIASAMATESENLFVLSAEESLDEPVAFSPTAAAALVDALPDDLSAVVTDIPLRLATQSPGLLARSDKIVLVTDMSLAGMRDVVRLATMCRAAAPQAALYPVVNRVGIGGKGEIPKAEFVKGTGLPLHHAIPFEPKIAAAAANTGKPIPVIASRSATTKATRKLVADLFRETGEKAPTTRERQKPKGLLSFGRKK